MVVPAVAESVAGLTESQRTEFIGGYAPPSLASALTAWGPQAPMQKLELKSGTEVGTTAKYLILRASHSFRLTKQKRNYFRPVLLSFCLLMLNFKKEITK
jgi:hypothetical protein